MQTYQHLLQRNIQAVCLSVAFFNRRAVAAFALLMAGSAILAGGSALPASAQISVVNTLANGTSPITSTSDTISDTFTVTGGNAIVVELQTKQGDTSAFNGTLSWNGVTLNLIGSEISNAGTYRKVGFYYAPISSTGTSAISGSATSNNGANYQESWLTAYTLSGVDNSIVPSFANGYELAADSNGATVNTLTFTNNIAAGSLAVVNDDYGNSGFTETIQDSAGGNSTLVQDNADAATSVALGYISGLGAGPQTITATASGGVTNTKSPFIAAIFTPAASAPEPSQWVALLTGGLGLGALVFKARKRGASELA